MNVNIAWQDETRRIVRLDCSGAWNWPDIDVCMGHWLKETVTPVDGLSIVIDIRNVTMIPNDLILHVKPAIESTQDADIQIVVVAANAAAVTTFKLLVTMYKSAGQKFHLVSSDEEALELFNYPV